MTQDSITDIMNTSTAFLRHLTHSVLCAVIIALAGILPAQAQDFSVSATVDRTRAALDEQVRLDLSVSGGPGDMQAPTLSGIPNFTAYPAGRSQSMSFVNGTMSSEITFSYTLVPQRPGKFTIPPLGLSYKGKTFETQPIQMEITPPGASVAASDEPAAEPAEGRDTGEAMFTRASVDKQRTYTGEQITYTFSFYRRIQLAGNPQYDGPSFEGFWSETSAPVNRTAVINGIRYAVVDLKTTLFPTREGSFTIPGGRLRVAVPDNSDPFGGGFFGGFFGATREQTLAAPAVRVTVEPLPAAGKPADFSGTVGRYTIAASVDKTQCAVNDAVTLTVTVSGTGNIKAITAPELTSDDSLRKYETVSTLTIEPASSGTRGSKTFKTVIVPQVSGTVNLPPIIFHYFDPAAQTYNTARAPAIALTVRPAPPGTPAAVNPLNGPGAPAGRVSEITVVKRDINYLKPLARWPRSDRPLYRSPLLWGISGLSLLWLFLSGIISWRRAHLSSDTAGARNARAGAAARGYLGRARKMIGAAPPADYYCALSRALLEYLAHRLGRSPEGLTSAAIAAELTGRSAPSELIARVQNALSECDLVRFSPSETTQAMKEASLNRAAVLINELERALK